MRHIVGIDLGTTNSLCAVFEDGSPVLIPNVHGNAMTPSIVGVLKEGRVVVGATAKELGMTHPERCAWSFKRWMGSDRAASLGGRSFTAPELSSLVLRSLKEDAETYLDGDVSEAVITVPAYFNDNQRKATKFAGELAGLEVRRIINEPTAAALCYGLHDRQAEKRIVVIDLGGGTFDVTAMDIFGGAIEIVATAGESFLGGEDFTDRLVSWALRTKGLQLENVELSAPLMVARLRHECENAKRVLTRGDVSSIRIPDQDGHFHEESSLIVITRDQFNSEVDILLNRLTRPISKAIRDSELTREGFSEVVLVGGATRMPAVIEFVRSYFHLEPLSTFNPDEVVALGAAVQAALIRDDKAVADVVMTDVCPFTLGVEISKEFGRQNIEGYFLPVIHRNTTIPVSQEELVQTLRPNQRAITVNIYQGEARKVKENLHLGTLAVQDIPAGPAGKVIHIRFTYDINGILEVEAYVPETGGRFRTVVTNNVKGMSPFEIAKAARNLNKIKFYPRDDVRNQHLLLWAEQAVGELNSVQRLELEEVLDAFEQSMARGDRLMFKSCRDSLIALMRSFGFENDGASFSGDDE